MNQTVPFFSNTPDDTHCFQACLKMVLKYFLPEQDFSWEELEELTGKKGDLWTWPMQGALSLKEMGFDVVDIDVFDYAAFVERGTDYLTEIYGEEISQAQEKHSDIPEAQRISKDYLKSHIHTQRIPNLEDVSRLLSEGFLVGCNVNSYALNNQGGYAGHFVLIYAYDDRIHLHDPGLPPQESRQISLEQFLKGWENGYVAARNLLAFRRPRASTPQ
jgi:hypothetical protein